MEEDKFLKKSEFNAAAGMSMALVNLLMKCDDASSEEDYHVWKKEVWNVYKSVDCKLTKDERIECKKKMEVVRIAHKGYLNKVNSPIKTFGIVSDLPDKLFELELLLRKYADAHGMLNPTKKDLFSE